MLYCRGLRPPRAGAIQLRFGAFFSAADLPIVPVRFGRAGLIKSWGMFGNDKWGCCAWAGSAHETMMLCADAATPLAPPQLPPAKAVPIFQTENILADYAAATGFNPTMPFSDQGTDLQQMCAYRQKTGIIDFTGKRHTIDVYADLRVGDLAELSLATYLNGATGVGVSLPSNAEDQFDNGEVWSVVPNQPGGDGHYISCIGRNSVGNYIFVTWGRLQAATPAWVQTYMNSGVAYISRERLNAKGLSPQGYNAAALNDNFKQLTGVAA